MTGASQDPQSQPADAGLVIPAIAADGSLYRIGKLDAHKQGTLHLAISAFVYSDGELLIQQRAAGKYHSGLLWANTCCSHPHWDEPMRECAERRLTEELGFTVSLTDAGVVTYKADVGNGLWEHERVHLFLGRADRATLAVAPNPDEVADYRWIGIDDLRAEINTHPERFTAWLRIYFERWSTLFLPAA